MAENTTGFTNIGAVYKDNQPKTGRHGKDQGAYACCWISMRHYRSRCLSKADRGLQTRRNHPAVDYGIQPLKTDCFVLLSAFSFSLAVYQCKSIQRTDMLLSWKAFFSPAQPHHSILHKPFLFLSPNDPYPSCRCRRSFSLNRNPQFNIQAGRKRFTVFAINPIGLTQRK